jgi:hypothetical protein
VVRAYELTFVKAAEDDFDRVIASTHVPPAQLKFCATPYASLCADEFAQTAVRVLTRRTPSIFRPGFHWTGLRDLPVMHSCSGLTGASIYGFANAS